MSEPTGAGWVYGCAVCRDRPVMVALCKCLDCGGNYALCFPCLNAMAYLGMVNERIEEHVEEMLLGDAISRQKVTVNKHDLTRCPKDARVRAAVLLARK